VRKSNRRKRQGRDKEVKRKRQLRNKEKIETIKKQGKDRDNLKQGKDREGTVRRKEAGLGRYKEETRKEREMLRRLPHVT
jgi:hypothetical protein